MSHSDAELFSEIHQLVTERITGQMTPARFQRLELLLRTNPAARRTYVEYLQETVALQSMLGPHEPIALPPLTDEPAEGVIPRRQRQLSLRPAGVFHRIWQGGNAANWATVAVVIAALAALITIVLVMRHGKTWQNAPEVAQAPVVNPAEVAPVARLTRTSDCRWSGDGRAEIGDELKPGRKLVLETGLAQITYRSGAEVLLQGPATIEIGSAKSACLRQGKLYVTVENALARGFEVQTPGMKYTDLGTEFGVMVAQDGAEEMHVFRGTVTAQSLGEGVGVEAGILGGASGHGDLDRRQPQAPGSSTTQPANSAPPPLTLTANQAIRLAAAGKPIEQFAANEKQFARAMPGIEPIPIFSTGVGLNRGDSDSHWNIIKLGSDQGFKPRAAVVAVPDEVYLRDARDKAQWISLTKDLPYLPGGCRMTFRTRFDLTGFDAATARIEGECATDDWPVELRVNGRSSVPLPPAERTLTLPVVPLHIDSGFVAGENIVEIVVENADVPKMLMNHMALYVHWKGTARRLAKKD